MKFETKTWPYGKTRRGTVSIANWRPRGLPAEAASGQLIMDDKGEGHICVGEARDATAKDGDSGTLTFTQGGPTGGYWKFEKDKNENEHKQN